MDVVNDICDQVSVMENGRLSRTYRNQLSDGETSRGSGSSMDGAGKVGMVSSMNDIIPYLSDYFAYVLQYQNEIWRAIGETFIMVGISILCRYNTGSSGRNTAILCRKGQQYENRLLFSILNALVNVIRSFPFLLLVVIMIPVTRWIVGTSWGRWPRGAFIRRCGGLLFKAGRAILAGGAEGSDGGGRFHGASTLQMIYKFL